MTTQDTPTASMDWTSVEARYAGRARLLAEAFAANKAMLFEALAAAAVTTVVVGFDGTGDSGQIEGVDAFKDDISTPLPAIEVRLASVPSDGAKMKMRLASLAEALEEVAYNLLEASHDGWEDNEGAFGEFTFNVAERSIRLDFNQRIETSELSVFEW